MLDVKLNLANRKKGLINFTRAIKAKKVLNAYYAQWMKFLNEKRFLRMKETLKIRIIYQMRKYLQKRTPKVTYLKRMLKADKSIGSGLLLAIEVRNQMMIRNGLMLVSGRAIQPRSHVEASPLVLTVLRHYRLKVLMNDYVNRFVWHVINLQSKLRAFVFKMRYRKEALTVLVENEINRQISLVKKNKKKQETLTRL